MPANSKKKCSETMQWYAGFFVYEPATRNKISYQTVGKAISAGFKTQTFQADFQALSKYSPVTLHYFPATAILNETPGIFIHYILEIKPFLKLSVSST